MRKQARDFLETILAIPSPSGFEAEASRAFLDYVRPFAAETASDVHGNAMAVVNPEGSPRVMLAGHIDQIGLMVKFIQEKGFLYFHLFEGLDPMLLPGQRVIVHGAKGPVRGVIGRKPIHLVETAERTKIPKLRELWIDIGVTNKKEAAARVAVGDPITFDVAFQELACGRAISAAFDDKAGVYVIAEAARRLAAKRPKAAVYAVATVQEEVGLRGARTSTFGIDPQVGIAVDVTFASDSPDVDKKSVGDIKLGGGPVIEKGANFNPVLVDRMLAVARRQKIPHQVSGAPRPPGTDANAMQLARGGVATGLVSIPLRYMHTTVETLAIEDIGHIVRHLAAFAEALDPGMDFTP